MANRVFTQTFGVIGAIIEKEGKFLLVQENNPKHPDHGKWNQPAGWIEVGENPIDAVKKEVLEETGYIFEPTSLLGIYSIHKDYSEIANYASHGIKLIFKGNITGGTEITSNSEILAVRWFSAKKINDMDGSTLRDLDIKQEIKDYTNNINFPLSIIHHSTQ